MVAFDRTQRLAAVINLKRGESGDAYQFASHEWSKYYEFEPLQPPRTASGGRLMLGQRIINRFTRRAACFVHVPGSQPYKSDSTKAADQERLRAWNAIASKLVPQLT